MTKQLLESEANEYINNHPENVFKRAKKKGFICPLCSNGTGKSGTGLALDPRTNHYKCFSCGEQGDVIHFIGRSKGFSGGDADSFKASYEAFGFEVLSGSGLLKKSNEVTKKLVTSLQKVTAQKEEEVDQTAFYEEAQKHLKETEYLLNRGISYKTQERFRIGFIKNYIHPSLSNRPPEIQYPTDRIIIPTSDFSYVARSIDGNKKAYKALNYGKAHLFNESILKEDDVVFIVEGAIDALSIEELGFKAVALNSISNQNVLLRALEGSGRQEKTKPLVLCGDADEAGQRGLKELEDKLREDKICYLIGNILNGIQDVKDANEALLKDKSTLKTNLESEFKRGVEYSFNEAIERDERTKQELEEYSKSSVSGRLNVVIDSIEDGLNTPALPTGFKKLDSEEALDGGLYEGLYILGAISSLGKTTFALQVASNLAKAGHDVMIFSLEMAESELIAKFTSAESYRLSMQKVSNDLLAVTTRTITRRDRWGLYGEEVSNNINESFVRVSEYGNHLFIREGLGDYGVTQITNEVKKHIKLTGTRPVVIVDYLQLIAPADVRASDKQNTDKAVLELKRLSRDNKLTILAISSLNRSSYNSEINMQAFKESGAIEYGADVLMGLQYKDGQDVKEAMKVKTRDVELCILKNRNGRTGAKITYNFTSMFNYFEEC